MKGKMLLVAVGAALGLTLVLAGMTTGAGAAVSARGKPAISPPTHAVVANRTPSPAAARRLALLRKADLSTNAGAPEYLRSVGLDPRTRRDPTRDAELCGPEVPGEEVDVHDESSGAADGSGQHLSLRAAHFRVVSQRLHDHAERRRHGDLLRDEQCQRRHAKLLDHPNEHDYGRKQQCRGGADLDAERRPKRNSGGNTEREHRPDQYREVRTTQG